MILRKEGMFVHKTLFNEEGISQFINLLPFDLLFPKRKILDSSKLKEFADNNLKLDENGSKFSKWVETLWEEEKLLITSNFSFSHSVFESLLLQTRKNQGLFGKGLRVVHDRIERIFAVGRSLNHRCHLSDVMNNPSGLSQL